MRSTAAQSVVHAQPRAESQVSMATWIAFGGIFLFAIVLRFVALGLKPLHNDEGVNGYFLYNLFLHNQYAYDPRNYHGPSLYYLALPFIYLFGTSVYTLRGMTGVFSLLTLWMLFSLRDRIGTRGALYAALLLCISPGSVFFARYFIHETLVACFTLGVAMAAWDYADTHKPSSLFWCSLCAGLLFATKETAAIECAILGVSVGCMKVWMAITNSSSVDVPHRTERLPKTTIATWVITVVIFLAVNFVLYSSFFTHYKGVSDALHSPLYWFGKSGDQQVHPWWQYISWMWGEDPALLVLGLCGVIWALIARTSRFCVFSAFWAMGTILAYSIMGYKTPWLVLNMLVPMAIVAGGMLGNVIDLGPASSPEDAKGSIADMIVRAGYRIVITAMACFFCLSTDLSLNLHRYDDDRCGYVYSQTRRGFFGLYHAITSYSASRHDNGQTAIAIVSPDYWPMPWYFRKDNNAGYYGAIPKAPLSSDTRLIVASQVQEAQLIPLLGNGFVLQGRYDLRPGVVLDLYVRDFP